MDDASASLSSEPKFQFQTGAIKRCGVNGNGGQQLRRFQFQTGAIKRSNSKQPLNAYLQGFNSKLVRLKACHAARVPRSATCFNSKLVRLKECDTGCARVACVKFQFQTGAIKRWLVGYFRYPQGRSFNSKLVRLKVGSAEDLAGHSPRVSIPNWCD